MGVFEVDPLSNGAVNKLRVSVEWLVTRMLYKV